MRRGEPAASQEAAASTTVFQALVQAALADAAAGAQDDEAEGEAADDAGVGEPGMSFLQATDADLLCTYPADALERKCTVKACTWL